MQVVIGDGAYISHEDPVWRRESHHVAMVDLAPFDLDGMREQLWLREVEGGEGFEVCCIPFFAYGLALGDVVGKSESDVVDRVISKSGRRVMRVVFAEPRPAVDGRLALLDAVKSVGLLSEWNGDRHVAVDVVDLTVMQPVVDAVQEEIRNETAFWEWADSRVFTAG